ncbi:MAG: S-layer homology domain-containing protein [Acidimicrobiia bacterium]
MGAPDPSWLIAAYEGDDSGRFTDDDGSIHKPDIEAIADLGITLGCSSDGLKFCPNDSVTRAQMASFLSRALGLNGSVPSRFTDDNDSIHEADIEAIAALGITLGCNSDGTKFCPNDAVTRAQMASFIARALELTASGPSRFTDDNGSVHEPDIEAIAALGITVGCTSDGLKFCPNDAVTRAQMASFLARAFVYP